MANWIDDWAAANRMRDLHAKANELAFQRVRVNFEQSILSHDGMLLPGQLEFRASPWGCRGWIVISENQEQLELDLSALEDINRL